MKRRVLIFSTGYLPLIGGAEIAIKQITDRLPDFEFDLITARFSKKISKSERLGNINVYRVGWGSKLDKLFLPILGFIKAKKLKKPEIVHSYQASYGAGAAWLFKLFNRSIPLIITLQEGKDLNRQNLLIKFFRRLIIKNADRGTAISNYLKDYIFKVNKDLRTIVIPNGVDVADFSKNFSYGEMSDLEKKLQIMPDDKVIISTSRLVPKNGIDLLIKAMPELNKSSKESYKLILIGDGSQKEELLSSVRDLNIADQVIFAGSVAHELLPIYFKISDVFVRPSRSEGLGISFLESMAAGVPIIGTNVGGIPDFLYDRKTGLMANLKPEDIAFKIRTVMENEVLREEIIRNAKVLVQEKYSWNKIADEFKNLYQSL